MSEVREHSTPPTRILRHIIRKARSNKEISIDKIAGLAGLDRTTYDKFEKGFEEIDDESLWRIIDALDIEVAREWMRVAHVGRSEPLTAVASVAENVAPADALSDALYELSVGIEDALNRLGARRNRNYTVMDVMRFALEVYMAENAKGRVS
jgi:transcriptional regulator with XRE-family HTH domain